ncbi:rubrerythrin family protein [Lachnospiraceae bacterium]|nr:rubrerythrin family protein [Lachnospiraceae bacterium]
MEENKKMITNPCSFSGVRPAMADLPYPPIQVSGRNQAYADLLGVDYCGAVSELSAITQYINNENRISYEKCTMARTLLGIAVAEMMHLQKLGELIVLLGGNIDFTAKLRNGKRKMWTPEYLNIPENVKRMLLADVEAEREAIRQYEMHIQMIADPCVNAVLERIIKDEEYHIMLLKALLQEV